MQNITALIDEKSLRNSFEQRLRNADYNEENCYIDTDRKAESPKAMFR
jgi:hypothetical protein